MSLRDIHLGFKIPFDSPDNQDDSEYILLMIMGLNARLNSMYLRNNPSTPNLYDSGVYYTPPDQADGRPPVDRDQLQKLLKLLREMGQEPETALMIVRMLKGIEIFLDIPALYRRGKGDCNELVPVRLAELWRGGVAASPYLIKQRNDRGGWTYHALVLHPDGSSECPSLILGMGGTAAADFREEEIRKNVERWDNSVRDAAQLASVGVPGEALSDQIDSMGLVPKSGVFESPYARAA